MATASYHILITKAADAIARMLPTVPPAVAGDADTVLAELRAAADALDNREILFSWSVDDVLAVRDDLTPEQANEVLGDCASCHDASIGMNWEFIRYMAHSRFPDSTIPSED